METPLMAEPGATTSVPPPWSSSVPCEVKDRGQVNAAGARNRADTARENLIEVLGYHARVRPDQKAYIYLRHGQGYTAALTYAQVDRRSRAIAAKLQGMGLAGECVLLAYPHGLDFITGFLGCLYAGCVAVPTYLPQRRTLERFHAIHADAGAHLVLSSATSVAQYQTLTTTERSQAMNGASLAWLATDEIPLAMARQWRKPALTPASLAMLQYTSGSTSEPKGVMVSHSNLMHNTRSIHRAFGMGCDIGVSWLPVYHDMGLIGGILEPLLAGLTSILMAPAAFLQEPFTWLAAICKYRVTIAGGPGFAYDLCVRRITGEQRATLDLSSWSLAFIGAEPIAPRTIERFADAFATCGFNRSAFYPCYGLAEATLMVSGAERGKGPIIESFDAASLSCNDVEPKSVESVQVHRRVSCGTPIGDQQVLIVDPRTCTRVAAGCEGEIWVAGGSVGQGYWHNPEQTSRVFEAHLRDTGEGPFLRTGDLGLIQHGQLYVTGRRDDLIIVRGVNHHPQDMEATVRQSHPLLEAGFGTAFSVEEQGEQRLILVQEAARNGVADWGPVLAAAREAVLMEHGLCLHTIALVRWGTIPKTASGKVQRRAARAAYLAGEFKFLAADHHSTGSPALQRRAPVVTTVVVAAPAARISQSGVLAAVCQHAVALGGAALRDVTPDTPLTALGLDSLQRVELAAMLEKTFACQLPDTDFNPTQTLGELAHVVQQRMGKQVEHDFPLDQVPRAHYDFTRFPEFIELKRYECMLRAVAGDNPYFRVDEGSNSSACITRTAGRDLVNFGLYDYIGMAHDAQVTTAAKAAIDRYGTSAGASRLVSGEKQVHRDLEQALAAFLGAPAAIAFVSGHATNVTTIGHLIGPQDLIVHDVLAHNSIIQGAQLSGAARRVFAHNDWASLDAMLSEIRHRYRRVLIAIEGVYSMDGDYPDLPHFVELRKKHKTLMLVDEAHSLGTMGATGRGLGEHWNIARSDVDLWMGTLSKSLVSCGGYIAGSTELVEYLGYTAPGFVYSVGMSPASAAAALAALTVLQAQPQRVSRLRELAALFLGRARARGLNTGLAAGTPVVPVILGNSVKSLRLSRALFDRGINVQPILHPAVPERSARLRFFITINHSEEQIRDAVDATADELGRL